MAESIEVDPEYPTGDNAATENQEQVSGDPQSPGSVHRSAEKSPSSTKSLSYDGSVFQQILENGRAYANETYFMPCDEQEQTRIAVTHQCFTSILNGQLSFQNIPRTATRILDIGTGTGDWAIAVAEKFPNAEVVATDITCFQPTDVPPNLFFEIDDAQEEWTYTDPFDFIHIRGLSGAFTDWTAVYEKAFKHLNLNGILEVADFGPIKVAEDTTDSYLSIYHGALTSAAAKANTPLGLDHVKNPLLENAGFSVAKSRTLDVPLGTWSPDSRKKEDGADCHAGEPGGDESEIAHGGVGVEGGGCEGLVWEGEGGGSGGREEAECGVSIFGGTEVDDLTPWDA